jgi:hypothetical protein
MSLNPFQPFASILGLRIYDVPVVEDNLWYFETLGSDFWLLYDVASLKSCVVRTSGEPVSEWRWNSGYAVQDLQHVMELEADGLLSA